LEIGNRVGNWNEDLEGGNRVEIGVKVWKLEIGWKLELRFGNWK
jgi:hypothetical protein